MSRRSDRKRSTSKGAHEPGFYAEKRDSEDSDDTNLSDEEESSDKEDSDQEDYDQEDSDQEAVEDERVGVDEYEREKKFLKYMHESYVLTLRNRMFQSVIFFLSALRGLERKNSLLRRLSSKYLNGADVLGTLI
jgi:hypothetical protein